MIEINNKKYFIKNLVIGQLRQLIELKIDALEIDKDEKLADIVEKIMKHIPVSRFLAIILNPCDSELWKKNVDELEQEIEFSLYPEQVEEIINDFFALCPQQKIVEDMLKIAIASKKLAQVI